MPKETIISLENLIFATKSKPLAAASVMAGIIGVLIDLKPVSESIFMTDELALLDHNQFMELMEKLELKALFFHHSFIEINKLVNDEYVYISRATESAIDAHVAVEDLWSTMDDYGQIIDTEAWQNATKKIGHLLGYPASAIEEFANLDLISETADPDRIARMERNRYYSHSTAHEEQEFNSYDLKLNQAIAEYAPRTAQIYASDKSKRWL